MNVCKFQGSEYDKLKQDLLNGKVVEYNLFFEQEETPFSEYFLGDITIDGKILSKPEKLGLLNSISEDIVQSTTISSEQRQSAIELIENLRTQLGTERVQLHQAKVVILPDFNNHNILKNIKVSPRKILDVSDTRGKFIPILNSDLNNHATSVLLSSLKEICLWDESLGKIIRNNKDLTKSILAYRDSLFSQLCRFTNTQYQQIPSNLTTEDESFYREVLKNAWDKIKNFVTEQQGIIDLALDPNLAENYINPIIAFYTLQNFDDVLSYFLKDFITINNSEYGNIESSEDKYKLKLRKKVNSSFDDGFASSDGENLQDKILDTFITSTQIGDGLYLNRQFKDNFLCVLKNTLENTIVKTEDLSQVTVVLPQDLKNRLEAIISHDSDQDLDGQIQTLIEVLTTINPITETLGVESCKAFGERLKKFTEALNVEKSKCPSKEIASLDEDYNVGAKFLSNLDKGIVALTQITGPTDTRSISPGTKKKGKQYVTNRLQGALLKVLGGNHRILTDPKPLLIGNVSETGIVDLYSKGAQEILTKITGINFKDDEILKKFSTNEGLQILGDFIRKYREVVQRNWKDGADMLLSVNKKFAENVITDLTKEKEYVEFSRLIVEENQFEMERSFDQEGREQAKTTIANLSTQLTKNLRGLKKYVGENSKNILLRWPQLIKQTQASYDIHGRLAKISHFNQHITFGGDVKYLNGETARWIKQNPTESNAAFLNQLYLFNILNHNTLSFQIDVTSDKVKTPIANINLENNSEVNLIETNLKTLKRIKQEQLKSYYDKVESDILGFFNKILNTTFTDLISLDEHLQANVTEEQIINSLREIQKTDQNFTALPEVHYSVFKGTVLLNRQLCYEIFKSKSVDGLQELTDKLSLNNFKKDLIDQKVSLTLTGDMIDKLTTPQKNQLAWLFFDTVGDEKDVEEKCAQIKEALKTNNKVGTNPFFDYFLQKFVTLENIVREADLEVFNKHYWVHGGTQENLDLNKIKSGDVETIKRLMSGENSKRIEKSTKRNNSQSATESPMSQGLKYGVPSEIRIASIESLRTNTITNFGDSDKLKSHDGAIFSSYIIRIMERMSQLQMNMADSSKIIALEPHNAGFYQIKCADYAMSNSWIRNTIKSSDSYSDQFYDGRKLYELMLRPATTEQLLRNLKKHIATNFHSPDLGLRTVYYNFQGKLAYLDDYEVINTNTGLELVPTWVYYDGTGKQVPVKRVADTLGLEYNIATSSIKVKNLYDLWNFFGAENSMSNVDGKIDFTDISQEYVAYLISDFDPTLKSKMISKICDPESVKATPFPINSRKSVFEDNLDLVTATIKTSNYGPQQDYNHETDEDEIPFTTQVISAIAFNGENSELVQDLYETIGDITAEALSEITELSSKTNKSELYKKIGKLIAISLKSNEVVSNAATILEEQLRQVVDNEEVFAVKALPLSDNNIYHLAAEQILSKLNKMIKQRFAGVAVVQNPSRGIIGVFQDKNGVTYNKSDIIKRALNWYNKLAEENKTLRKTDDIVEAFLKNHDDFQDETLIYDGKFYLPFNKLNISDNVRVIFDEGADLSDFPLLNELSRSEIEIESPMLLQELYSAAKEGLINQLDLIHGKPRNLSTTQITFEDEKGRALNIWLLESTKAIINEALNGKSKGVTLEKYWHKENMRGLGDKIAPYYYATLGEFKAGVKTYIKKETLVYKGGEEVLPKQYKKKYSIDGSMADILQLEPEYFITLAERRLKANPNIELSQFGEHSFIGSTNYFDIIFTDKEGTVNENVEVIQEGNKYSLYFNDERIENVSLPSQIACKAQLVRRDGEKPVIVIQTTRDISHDENYINRLLELTNLNTVRFAQDLKLYDKSLQALDENNLTEEKINQFATQLRTSFELTRRTVSVRIPSQSFQSFLANQTVLFTETDDNNGYMNMWEMFFQGSDHDIDKAYTIMFDPGETGVIEGNTFSDYSSPDKLMESLLLRRPNKNLRIWDTVVEEGINITEFIQKYVIDNINDLYNLTKLNELLDTLNNGINSGKVFYYDPDIVAEQIILNGQDITEQVVMARNQLVLKLNEYNAMEQNETYKKNKVMAGIRYAAQDIHNLQASQVPMTAEKVNSSIDDSYINNNLQKQKTYYNEDPGHISYFQYQNAIGKEGVGISANGIKVLSPMEQNTNIKIQQGKLLPINYVENDLNKTGLNLEFLLNTKTGTRVAKEKILKVPNTPMTREQFDNFYRPYQTLLPVYEVYQKLINNQDYQPATSEGKEQKFIDCYNILANLNNQIPEFLDVLYLADQFEQNAADMMSIFISLSTDNAKELRLFMIGATPDLLNLPLAMVALGMDIQDITDICVQYIVPIMKEMNVNKYTSNIEPQVEQIINKHILDKSHPELKATYESIMKIYKVAQEMKLMASQFKVNQGTSVKPAEVQEFLTRLEKFLTNPKNLKVNKKAKSYKDFFDPDLVTAEQNIKEASENYKATAINVIDIITGAKNFFKQLEACYRVLGVLEDNIAVSHITAEIANSEELKSIKNKRLNTEVQQVVQNALLTQALTAMPDITFEKSETKKFGEWGLDLAPNSQIGVSTKMRIDNFIQFMEEALIPYLQKTYSDNFFVQILRRDAKNGYYELPFNSFEVKGDLRTKMDITKATMAFSQISQLASGLHTIDGTDISYGDLMYLYATIVNSNRVNTLSTITKDAAVKGSKLNIATRITNYYAELDRLTGISTSENTDLEEQKYATSIINNIITTTLPYAKAKVNGGYAEVQVDGMKLGYQLDENFPLFTMIPGKIVIDSGGHSTSQFGWQEKVAKSIQRLLNDYNSTTKVLTDTIQKNGVELSFQIEIPGQMGKNPSRKLIRTTINDSNYVSPDDYENIKVQVAKNIDSLAESLAQIIDKAIVINEPMSINEHLNSYSGAIEAVYKTLGYDPNKTTSVDTFAQNVLNWMSSKKIYDKSVIITGAKYVRSHIDMLGEKPILVLNPTDLYSKDAGYIVLNLFLDSQLQNEIATPRKRIAKLLTLVTGENISPDTVKETLLRPDIQNKIKESKVVYNWYQNYLDDNTEQSLKQTAYNNLYKFGKALEHPEFYYYQCDESLDNEVGDIFKDNITGDKYIYLGNTDENIMIFRNLNPESLEATKLTYRASTGSDQLMRILKPRINSDYSNLTLSPKDKSLYQNIITTNIHQGDLVTTRKGEYYISSILYEKLPNGIYNTILLGSSDGKILEEISNKITNVKRIPVEDISSETDFNVELPHGSLRLKETIVKNMSYGQRFKYYNGDTLESSRFKSFSDGYITTTDGKLLTLDSLAAVDNFDLVKIYPKLPVDTAVNSIISPSKDPKVIAGLIYGRPEFRYGYDVGPLKDGKVEVTPKYVASINGKKVATFKPFNINPDLKYRGNVNNTTKLGVNDTVITLEQTKDQSGFESVKYVVLENLGDQSVVLESRQPESRLMSIVNNIKVINNSQLTNGKLYRDESRRSNVTLAKNKQVLTNDYDAVYSLLKYLSDKFGARVEFVNADDNFKARVNNGVIEINLNKKLDSQSEADFIMEQGIHEFMHLAITALKIDNPEIYFSLLDQAKKLETVNNKIYNTEISQNEERLVRKLTDMIMSNTDQSISADSIESYMLKALQNLLGLENTNVTELQNSLKNMLSRSSLFSSKQYTQEEMRIRTLKDEYMDKIKYECE